MNWLYYLLEANLYITIFYAIYYILLRTDTFYQLNRVYLLISCLIAFLLPMMQLGILKPASINPAVNTDLNYQIISQPLQQAATTVKTEQAHINYYLLIYTIITGLLLIHFVYKIFRLIQLAHQNKRINNGDHQLIEIDDEAPAFSFFKYLFINQKLAGSATIIRHELVHIRQRHSWDVIYLELIKIICWFNPAVYLLQNSLKELHEYIADEQINYTRQDINNYTDFLLSAAYGAHTTSLTNNFFNKNLLKKRIMMLHQKRSGYLARLKYLAVMPTFGGMLCVSTLAFSKSYHMVDLLPAKKTISIKSLTNNLLQKTSNAIGSKAVATSEIAKPQVTAKAKQYKNAADTTLAKTNLEELYKYIAKYTRYPAKARDNNVGGKVFVAFTLNNSKKIEGLKVLRTPSKYLSDELVRVLLNCDKFSDLKPGITYTMPVDFSILSSDDKNVGINTDETAKEAYQPVGNTEAITTNKTMFSLNEVVIISYAKK